MHFRYLQLRHALQAQLGNTPPNIERLDISYIIMGLDSRKRISGFYNLLLLPTATTLAYKRKDCWSGDVVGGAGG